MKSVIERTHSTLEMASEAGSVLATIAENSQSMSAMITAVADAVTQQNQAAKEISSTVERVADVAEKNTDMSRQSSLVAIHLNKLCESGEKLNV